MKERFRWVPCDCGCEGRRWKLYDGPHHRVGTVVALGSGLFQAWVHLDSSRSPPPFLSMGEAARALLTRVKVVGS